MSVTGLVGNGSKSNVEELADGNAELAFCQSDVMAYAYNGTNLFENPIDCFSTVAALYMEDVQIVTTDPSIKTVADLAGKQLLDEEALLEALQYRAQEKVETF